MLVDLKQLRAARGLRGSTWTVKARLVQSVMAQAVPFPFHQGERNVQGWLGGTDVPSLRGGPALRRQVEIRLEGTGPRAGLVHSAQCCPAHCDTRIRRWIGFWWWAGSFLDRSTPTRDAPCNPPMQGPTSKPWTKRPLRVSASHISRPCGVWTNFSQRHIIPSGLTLPLYH